MNKELPKVPDAKSFVSNSDCAEAVVITQDYGLAALCLARSAQALHPAGHAYTKDNIDALLTVRAESARLRRGGVRLHRTAARKPAQDHAFSVLLCRILSENTGT